MMLEDVTLLVRWRNGVIAGLVEQFTGGVPGSRYKWNGSQMAVLDCCVASLLVVTVQGGHCELSEAIQEVAW